MASNHAQGGKAGGVICSGGEKLKNSILSGNDGSQFLGCAFDHSDIYPPGALPSGAIGDNCVLDAAFKPSAASKCINGGDNAGTSLLDLGNGPRIKSGTVDMGAYEVQ